MTHGLSIDVTYLRFYAGLKEQKIDRSKFIYRGRLQPWLSIWGILWSGFCILIAGFEAFPHFRKSKSYFITGCEYSE